jgi:hypothetical protein
LKKAGIRNGARREVQQDTTQRSSTGYHSEKFNRIPLREVQQDTTQRSSTGYHSFNYNP